VVDNGRVTATEEGTPQGGVISPLLLNIALHGIEQAAGVNYLPTGWVRVDSPVLIRCADDFVVHCHTRQDAMQIKARLAAWLTPRGLALNEQKTRIVSLEDGLTS
jgi:RNA-directed DNA polymerase